MLAGADFQRNIPQRAGLASHDRHAFKLNQRRILHDSAITARVKAALLAEKGIPSLSISVETYEGRVQLSGFVTSQANINTATVVAKNVTGVKSVKNDMRVK